VNGKQIPGEGINLDTGHEKTIVMGYKFLFEGSGIRYSNSGFQITHDMYISGYFMLLYDLPTWPRLKDTPLQLKTAIYVSSVISTRY